MIKAIFAIDEANGIGKNNKMPWPFNKEDLKLFKQRTTNQIVVMGKGTWDSSDMPTPLPNRTNIVVSNSKNQIRDADIVLSGPVDLMADYLKSLSKKSGKDVFIIGGAQILNLFKPYIEYVYLTKINGSYQCDVKLDLDCFLERFVLKSSSDLETCKILEYSMEN